MFRNKQLDRIEKKLSIIIERNYKVDNHKALSELKQPVSPAKAPKKRGRKSKTELEKKAKKAAYNKAYYQKRKVTTKKK